MLERLIDSWMDVCCEADKSLVSLAVVAHQDMTGQDLSRNLTHVKLPTVFEYRYVVSYYSLTD